MNKKSFLWGVLIGIVVTIAALYVIELINQNYFDSVHYLEKRASYEKKSKASFKVFQVFENAALANEESYWIGEDVVIYNGNTVVIVGENFYNGQVVTIKKPMRTGTYSYTSENGIPMTVPIIDGEME